MGFDDGDRDMAKYDGFKVHWDKDLRTYVFESKEERDRWQIHHYGQVRNAFREPGTPDDGRHELRYTSPPFKSAEEEARYERAAKLCPVSASGKLTLDEYLSEIVKLAEGIKPQAPALKTMPGGRGEP